MLLGKKISFLRNILGVIILGGCMENVGVKSGENVGTFFRQYGQWLSHDDDVIDRAKLDKIKSLKNEEFVNKLNDYSSDIIKQQAKRYAEIKKKEKKLNDAKKDKILDSYTKNFVNCVNKLLIVNAKSLEYMYQNQIGNNKCKMLNQFFKDKIPNDIATHVDNVIKQAQKKCKEEKTNLRLIAYTAAPILTTISILRFIIKNLENDNSQQAKTLTLQCKVTLMQYCKLFNEKTSKFLSDLSGLKINLYKLSQQNSQHSSINFSLLSYTGLVQSEVENAPKENFIISMPIGTFNLLLTVFLFDGRFGEDLDSKCLVMANTLHDVFIDHEKAGLFYLYDEHAISVLLFNDEIRFLRTLISDQITTMFYDLQKLHSKNLVSREKCIENIKASRNITVQDLRYFDQNVIKVLKTNKKSREIVDKIFKNQDCREVACKFFKKKYMKQLEAQYLTKINTDNKKLKSNNKRR